jgi:hypothetical protein
MEFLKKWDIYGKPVTFYYNTSTVHKTYFGALLSILSFSLMTTITITSLINFLYQKPAISSNLVYFINKKFAQLDAMVIVGKLTTAELDIEDHLNTFVKYYRIVLHEKYFDGMETFQVAKLVKTEDTSYEFNVTMSIKDVFKEKEFSTLKIMSCADIKQQNKVEWASYENEMSCDINYEKYFKKNFSSNSFLLSFDAPNYSVDRKGGLIKIPHQNKLNFKVILDKKFSYLMETKYVVIEDDTNIYYTHKKYDAYFTMKRPIEIKEDSFDKKFTLEILMQNNNNDQIVLISLHKYKLLDFLAKLGGIMKIITFMKMTGKFWSSYFYEKTLYNLLVKRDNPYLSQKKKLLESLIYKRNANNSNSTMNKLEDLKSEGTSKNFVRLKNSLSLEQKISKNSNSYASYGSWFINRFCKCFFVDKEAKQKREMLSETLGLNNYLLHLDYIDRQILLEQHDGDINKKIEEIINKNKEREEKEKETENELNADNTKNELQKEIKTAELALIEQVEGNDLQKPFNKFQ